MVNVSRYMIIDVGNDVSDMQHDKPMKPTNFSTACYPSYNAVTCSSNPCAHENAKCLAHPNAFCQPNNCGGCNAEFYDQLVGGNRVECKG